MAHDQQQRLRTAFILHQQGRLGEAAAIYEELIHQNQRNYDALHYLGTIRASFGNFDEARKLIERSLSAPKPNISFVENYATILFQIGDYQSALDVCANGLRTSKGNANLLYVSAIANYKLKRLQDSLAQFDAAVTVQPNHFAALNERGSVLAELKNYDAALTSVEKALALNPQYAEAYLNRGNICFALKHYDRSVAAYDKALSLNPNLPDAWLGLGNVLRQLKRYDAALAAYDKALALRPDMDGAWLGRGNVFTELKQYDDALAAYDKAMTLNPDLEYAQGNRLHAKLLICDWSSLHEEMSHLIAAVRDQKPATQPFAFLSIPSSPADQLQCAKCYLAEQPVFPALWRGEHYSHDRIRVAYLSADFRVHPIAYLMAGLFEQHDKSRFETTAISFGPDQDSDMRQRIKGAFERFIDVRQQSDHDIAELIRRLEIDIAVDLMGFTQDNRSNVLARRAAPIQVNYLGYAATMGASYVDYILADATIIPENDFPSYGEHVVWLPETFQVNDRQRRISEHKPTRRECGLPDTAFVFCCFNNTYKILPEMFDIWMRLMKATENSVLWLRAGNSSASANLHREAEKRGVAPGRLIFAPRTDLMADHLARHQQADLFLDTLPYNAHTTASDALWAGVPLLTCLGTAFAGRVSASLLKAVGLDELITASLEDYEALALKLAHEPSRLASLKERLARHRLTRPLFDTERFTRHLESAYVSMWERHQSGKPPCAFAVRPVD